MTLVYVSKNWKTEPHKPHIHALVIGVGHYEYLDNVHKYKLGQLTSPIVSAKKFTHWLIHNLNNPNTHLGTVELLLSTEKTSKQKYEDNHCGFSDFFEIRKGFLEWKKRCDTHLNNIAIFYFCGHGLQKGTNLCLLPACFGKEIDSIWGSTINFNKTYEAMKLSCKAQTQLYFVDVCRNYNRETLKQENFGGVSLLDTPQKTDGNPATLPLFSTSIGSKAHGKPNEVSRFTSDLIEAFNYTGDINGKIDIETLNRTVPELMEQRNRDLSPDQQEQEPISEPSNSRNARVIHYEMNISDSKPYQSLIHDLSDLSIMKDEIKRKTFFKELRETIPFLPPSLFDNARQDITNLVRTSIKEEMLNNLIEEVLRKLITSTPFEHAQIDRLYFSYQVYHIISSSGCQELDTKRFFQISLQKHSSPYPPDDLWDQLKFISGTTPTKDEIFSPYMKFTELIRYHLEQKNKVEQVDTLIKLLKNTINDLELGYTYDDLRSSMQSTTKEDISPHLTVIIEPKGGKEQDSQQQVYSLRMKLWSSDEEPPWLPSPDTGFSRSNLNKIFNDYINNRGVLEQQNLVIEFLLPDELLFDNVDQWKVDNDEFSRIYGKDYKIWVRSIERIKKEIYRFHCKKRWKKIGVKEIGFALVNNTIDMEKEYEIEIQCLETYNQDFSVLRKQVDKEEFFNYLNKHETITCLVFTTKPNQQHISIIRNTGIPIALWLRNEIQESITMLREVIEGKKFHLKELPQIVYMHRRQAKRKEPHHIGHHAVLLWDEPKRIPREFMKPIEETEKLSHLNIRMNSPQ